MGLTVSESSVKALHPGYTAVEINAPLKVISGKPLSAINHGSYTSINIDDSANRLFLNFLFVFLICFCSTLCSMTVNSECIQTPSFFLHFFALQPYFIIMTKGKQVFRSFCECLEIKIN
jgi:hypothetical protein